MRDRHRPRTRRELPLGELGRHHRLSVRGVEDAVFSAPARDQLNVVRKRAFLQHERRELQVASKKIPPLFSNGAQRDALGRRETLEAPIDAFVEEVGQVRRDHPSILRLSDAALVALDIAVETSTPSGEAMANMLATVSQLERRLISQRTKRRSRGGSVRLVTASMPS